MGRADRNGVLGRPASHPWVRNLKCPKWSVATEGLSLPKQPPKRCNEIKNKNNKKKPYAFRKSPYLIPTSKKRRPQHNVSASAPRVDLSTKCRPQHKVSSSARCCLQQDVALNKVSTSAQSVALSTTCQPQHNVSTSVQSVVLSKMLPSTRYRPQHKVSPSAQHIGLSTTYRPQYKVSASV